MIKFKFLKLVINSKLPVLFLIIFGAISSYSQNKIKKVNILVSVGPNISKYNPINLGTHINQPFNWNLGYNVGLKAAFNLSPEFYFNTGVILMDKKSESKLSTTLGSMLEFYVDGDLEYYRKKITYSEQNITRALQMPLILGYNINKKGKAVFSVYFGIYKEKLIYENSRFINPLIVWESKKAPPQEVVDKLADFGANLDPVLNNKEIVSISDIGFLFGTKIMVGRYGLEIGMDRPERKIYNGAGALIVRNPSITSSFIYRF